MLLKDLVKDLKVVESKGSLEVEISSIAYDSRKAKTGSLFVCVEGFKTDGHKYINDVVENGAVALLVQKDIEAPEGVTVVRIEDTRYGLASVADRFYNHPSGSFNLIGVTGTKGKTTTTYMVKAILEAQGQKVGLIGTISNMIGNEVLYATRTTPESLDLQSLFADMVEKKVNSVVMEVSSQGLALHRVSCSDYKIGVFTNLTRDHIGPGEHKDMDDYFEAKAKLFDMCKKGLVNIDSEYGKRIIEKANCEIITYGVNNDADIKAADIVHSSDSIEFKLKSRWYEGDIRVNIPGNFIVYNALAAIGACILSGISFEAIKEGLENVKVPGRAEIVEINKNFTVMIDYAHNPDSLSNILNTVKSYAKGRVICLFGCGGDRNRPRGLMGETVGNLADFTIITSDNPRTEDPASIIRDIEQGMKKTEGQYVTIIDRKEAIKYAIENAKENDIIILAGKGHETYQEFANNVVRFDEREVVREIIEENG